MKRSLVPLLTIVFGMLAACSTPMQPRKPETGGHVYFPPDSVSDFEQEWYASHLFAMGEPILSSSGKSPDYFALRLLYLPTWGRPIAIRYEVNGAHAVRRAVMLSGDGGYDPGQIKADHTTTPTQQQIAKLLLSLAESGYWSLAEKEQVMGTDGSQLILETIRNGQHKVLVRWTPEYNSDTRNLAKLVAFYTTEFKGDGFWSDSSE